MLIYRYICSETKIKGIPDYTDYDLKNNQQIKYYKIYYTDYLFSTSFVVAFKMYVSGDYLFKSVFCLNLSYKKK